MAISSDGNIYNWDYALREHFGKLEHTTDINYIAELQLNEFNIDSEAIAYQIASERSEFRPETIKNVLSTANTVYMQFLGQGYSVDTGNFILKPTIRGSFENAESVFQDGVHRKNCYYLVKKEVKELLEDVALTSKGKKPSVNVVTSAYVMGANATEWNYGEVLVIKGKNIKLNSRIDETGAFVITELPSINFGTKKLSIDLENTISTSNFTVLKNTNSEVRILNKLITTTQETYTAIPILYTATGNSGSKVSVMRPVPLTNELTIKTSTS